VSSRATNSASMDSIQKQAAGAEQRDPGVALRRHSSGSKRARQPAGVAVRTAMGGRRVVVRVRSREVEER